VPLRGGHHTYSIAVVAALIGAAGILVFLIMGSGVVAQPPPGLVHATEIKIAPEISGRLARFAATLGQQVRSGEDLVELVNPELSASLVLAEAQLDEARAARDRVYAGVRAEQVGALERQIETAKADLLFSQQELARKSKLAADGFASRQDLDEASAAVDVARAKLASAEETYQAAHLGPIREELAIADAKVEDMAAAVSVIAARVAKLRISAPADGVVKVIVAEVGGGGCSRPAGDGARSHRTALGRLQPARGPVRRSARRRPCTTPAGQQKRRPRRRPSHRNHSTRRVRNLASRARGGRP
jgi:HlyD family secretion protein